MPYDQDQIDNLDAELDDLSTPTTEDVLLHSRDYDAGIVAASAARRAINGGGGPGATALDDLTDVDLTGASDGDVLTKDGSDWVAQAPAGGSQPDPDVAAVFASVPEPEEGSTSAPTLAQIDSSYNVINGWSAEKDYSTPFAFNADCVIVLLPTGSANVFAAEINGQLTGTDEPVWADAPDVGDDISDGDVTWYNIGTQAAWPPAPVTFAVDTAYDAGTLLWPTSPNGHLYIVFPPGPFESAAEPDPWATKGGYSSGDATGYAYDLGTKLTTVYAGGELSTTVEPNASLDAIALSRLFVHVRDRVGYIPAIGVVTSENGYTFLAVNNETWILNNPDASSPPLYVTLVEGGGVLLNHVSLRPDDSGDAHALGFSTDNALKFSSILESLFAGQFVAFHPNEFPADGDLTNGYVAIYPDATEGLKFKFKTGAGAIKTLTLPWD